MRRWTVRLARAAIARLRSRSFLAQTFLVDKRARREGSIDQQLRRTADLFWRFTGDILLPDERAATWERSHE